MQYLSKDELISRIGSYDVKITDLISADTYNETEMIDIFNKYSKEDKILIIRAACQIAIIGYGNKNYGAIRIDNEKVIKLEDLFKRLNIKYNETQNSKYEPNTLSARRLTRLLRQQIRLVIEKNNKPSYLWTKYSEKNREYIGICFPGGEHIVETKEEAKFLLKTYKNLDTIMNTKFVDRLKRVFIARNIFTPIEIEDLISTI